MQDRLDRMPEAMGVRRQTVEHPFGTLKAWMGATHFLTRTLDKVRTEMSLHVLAYNLKRMISDLRRGTADGGDPNLIASLKPHAPADLPAPRPSWPPNTAHRPPPIARFPTASGKIQRFPWPRLNGRCLFRKRSSAANNQATLGGHAVGDFRERRAAHFVGDDGHMVPPLLVWGCSVRRKSSSRVASWAAKLAASS